MTPKVVGANEEKIKERAEFGSVVPERFAEDPTPEIGGAEAASRNDR